jgi:hypothetical protein
MTTALEGVRGQHHAPAVLYPRETPGTHVQEAGWVSGPVWTGAENPAPTGIRTPDRPAFSQSLRYPAHLKPGTSGYGTRVLPTLPARSISSPNHEARNFSPVSNVTRTNKLRKDFPVVLRDN